jgi:hemin uptake protein HemP
MTDNMPTSRKPAKPVPGERTGPRTEPAPVAPPVSGVARAAAPILDSDGLLRGNNSVEISHRGAIYRLQATRQGKLILTK